MPVTCKLIWPYNPDFFPNLLFKNVICRTVYKQVIIPEMSNVKLKQSMNDFNPLELLSVKLNLKKESTKHLLSFCLHFL